MVIILKLKSNYVIHDLGEGNFVIVDMDNTVDMNKMISTNQTGAFIFECISKGYEKNQIINELLKEYDVIKENLEKDYDAFIKKLVDNFIIE